MLQERDDVLDVLLDRDRAIRHVGGATISLKVHRDDRVALRPRRERLPGGMNTSGSPSPSIS
jgi:hypothetical protein